MKFYGELFLENDEGFLTDGAVFQAHISAKKRLLQDAVANDRLLTLGYAEGQSFKEVLRGVARDFIKRVGEDNIHCGPRFSICVFGLFSKEETPARIRKGLSSKVACTADFDVNDVEPPAWYRNAITAMGLKEHLSFECKTGRLTISFLIS